MRCCHVRKKAYLKKMTRVKFNLKKSYSVFGDILFQTATRLLKKKGDSLYCLARKTPFNRGWAATLGKKPI